MLGLMRIGKSQQSVEMRFRTVIARILLGHPSTYAIKHLRFQCLTHTPEQMIGDGVDARPEIRIAHIVAPFVTEIAVE